ncbi:hypothetical protein P153DRAFT_368730 [Dothidotthia symphoricarpi CBS 119687]|uniref:Ribosomal protein L17 n=1 Tax=Dothidotthia symphoricarpi CBS 119687 TaxID=1392245 RepID=A0A6A6A9B6_9PLEO|nr:uncharacterized protein P153DRAFT_368730 [Dothidotthia symphoricarpi CBS 119687]KAF2127438.1 hypothetical protein P153DRAFT_368730 [Dothidotthia symphoricarpi CBS 119687]
MVPKLFGPIRERYASRPGGYTRVLRIEPMKEDQAESALLEFVDGPKDMRFALTAKILANREPRQEPSNAEARNINKAIRFREDGVNELRDMIKRMRIEKQDGLDDRALAAPRTVYPTEWLRREMQYKEEVGFYEHPNKTPTWIKEQKVEAKKPTKARITENEITRAEVAKGVAPAPV